MAARPGKNVFHIGPERDLPIFDGLGLNFVPLEQADYVVCTGLTDDETETPESYRELLTQAAPARPVHGVRQSGPGGRARRQAGLLRRRARRSLRRARRRGALRRQAASRRSTMRRWTGSRRCAAARRRARACWRSAIRCAPISRAPPASGIDCLFVTAGIHAEELGRARSRHGGAQRDVRRRRRRAEGGDAKAGVVARRVRRRRTPLRSCSSASRR